MKALNKSYCFFCQRPRKTYATFEGKNECKDCHLKRKFTKIIRGNDPPEIKYE